MADRIVGFVPDGADALLKMLCIQMGVSNRCKLVHGASSSTGHIDTEYYSMRAGLSYREFAMYHTFIICTTYHTIHFGTGRI